MDDQPKRTTEKMCDPCLVEGKKEESTNFCVNCLEYFCINCARDHRKYKQSRDHTILEELPHDTTIYRAFNTFTRCEFHPEIQIEKFCIHHDAMICRYCLKDMHHVCDDVVDIDDYKKVEIEAIPQTLAELKTKCLEHKTALDMQMEEFFNNNVDVKDNILVYVQKVRDVADRVE
ncbi:hypothetical protein DPMN_061893 [Dreissena polymorpha]|uniref:B box-type domain-containing protein n=1 Tax=Dreissena polymorpha TaxID=45954 RepID=A0A9D4C891_DREPO|nr:hypothetical protein DPMN_061893 [Dreissena polymorpha]